MDGLIQTCRKALSIQPQRFLHFLLQNAWTAQLQLVLIINYDDNTKKEVLPVRGRSLSQLASWLAFLLICWPQSCSCRYIAINTPNWRFKKRTTPCEISTGHCETCDCVFMFLVLICSLPPTGRCIYNFKFQRPCKSTTSPEGKIKVVIFQPPLPL